MEQELFFSDSGNATRLAWLAVVGVGEYVMVTAAVMADLYSGLRKAQRNGIRRTSNGLRRSVSKLGSYLTLLLLLSIVDAVAIAATLYFQSEGHTSVPPFIWMTTLGSIGQVAIEAKSIIENIPNGSKLLALARKTIHIILHRFAP